MRHPAVCLGLAIILLVSRAAQAESREQTTGRSADTQSEKAVKKPADAEAALQRALAESGNDRAALVRNLEAYLDRFPDAPRKVEVYRAMVEAAIQLRDDPRALAYAERMIALEPNDLGMMLFAIDRIQRLGEEDALTRAVGYASRILDHLEKPANSKPDRASQADWEAEQKNLRMSVYLTRGRLHMLRRKYDEAAADLDKSDELLPSAAAKLRLGEIAELRKDYDKAIEHYLAAFVLPEQQGPPIDRREVRRKLGNLWQLLHGSQSGLGEEILRAYDRLAIEARPGEGGPNKAAGEVFDFVLRRAQGGVPLKLSEAKGKVLVLNFWATWCAPCRELEPLFQQVERRFEGQSDVFFLAVNGDEDESLVAPYLARESIRAPAVFADGLQSFLKVTAFPTVIVLDRTGKIVYRAQGFLSDGFVEGLSEAIERALVGSS